MKVCLVASNGGHLVQLLKVAKSFGEFEKLVVTFYSESLDEFVKSNHVYFVTDPRRSLRLLMKNAFESLLIAIRERPDVTVTTGAGVAIPLLLWTRLLGGVVIYIEDWCVTSRPSLSGIMAYPLSDCFFVQWPKLKRWYRRAVYLGQLY